ncbi:MAG TPA: hypothetical protein VFM98_08445, partial [Ramlibacter sp.]|uniref:hypothetical protein n=1 Tax=Ramlibacter sp. TaxID=1917967 RepID=UPI002D80C8D4
MDAQVVVEAILLALAWAGALVVRPWRLLRPHQGQVPLATPFLASLTLLPWLWSWPGLAALPFPLHWSGAPLVLLMIGWPLAIPVVTLAGFSTMLTCGASPAHALELTVWSGVLPATLMLLLGHAVRKALGPNPVAYLMGRGFFVPMLALASCALAGAAMGQSLVGPTGELQRVAIGLLALGEGSW